MHVARWLHKRLRPTLHCHFSSPATRKFSHRTVCSLHRWSHCYKNLVTSGGPMHRSARLLLWVPRCRPRSWQHKEATDLCCLLNACLWWDDSSVRIFFAILTWSWSTRRERWKWPSMSVFRHSQLPLSAAFRHTIAAAWVGQAHRPLNVTIALESGVPQPCNNDCFRGDRCYMLLLNFTAKRIRKCCTSMKELIPLLPAHLFFCPGQCTMCICVF